MAYGNALAVLADPTRRQVFERLRAGPRPVNVLAAGLPVSRPAVSQHLKALKDAGLVDERSEGVRRIYSLKREGLLELREWLDSFWGDALEAFKLEAEKSHKTRRSKRMSDVAVIAPVRKSVRVKAPIAHAFEVFTSGLTRWWPHDHGVGKKPIQKVLMEPRLGGRWLEISEDGTETSVATITLWEPPHRLVMLWQVNAQWKPDAAMKSEVDVRFSADGPDATRVELLHHRFETMGAEAGASMRKDVDGGWPGLIERFVQEAERSKG